ncbi:helix-turn-helix domain-containing protein [Aurantiacibacter spongiae]|uniref:DUF4019 domain-containing protein n=1 Tax=Aurantiacibacter spongiae TaxID=2488860 RepID=A0A3N5DSQ3_9SPHN|nr:DUF4019 domain-containing protein [Aurantiacibacter spongiae]RPF72291.1 DUF4019 domain-containing protein [Aurantiacibacter spongiae]
MGEALSDLTEKEKQALRLLLAGHDAKSSALELDLSVHAINDRLRAARRKLGVSSSREAARILGDAEGTTPQILAPGQLGVAGAVVDREQRQTSKPNGWGHRLAWLTGGMLMMSLLIAAAIYTTTGAAGPPPAAQASQAQADRLAGATVVAAARAWVELVDAGEYAQSWERAGPMFRAQVSAQQWGDTVRPVRAQLGALQSRDAGSGVLEDSLPGAPAGEYAVIQFPAQYAAAGEVTETVVLRRENGAWGVVGYFVR